MLVEEPLMGGLRTILEGLHELDSKKPTVDDLVT